MAGIEDSIDTLIHIFKNFIQKRGGRLVTATRNNTNDTGTSETTITRKHEWGEKQLYAHFKRLTIDISHEKMWTWLKKGNLKREIELF